MALPPSAPPRFPEEEREPPRRSSPRERVGGREPVRQRAVPLGSSGFLLLLQRFPRPGSWREQVSVRPSVPSPAEPAVSAEPPSRAALGQLRGRPAAGSLSCAAVREGFVAAAPAAAVRSGSVGFPDKRAASWAPRRAAGSACAAVSAHALVPVPGEKREAWDELCFGARVIEWCLCVC